MGSPQRPKPSAAYLRDGHLIQPYDLYQKRKVIRLILKTQRVSEWPES